MAHLSVKSIFPPSTSSSPFYFAYGISGECNLMEITFRICTSATFRMSTKHQRKEKLRDLMLREKSRSTHTQRNSVLIARESDTRRRYGARYLKSESAWVDSELCAYARALRDLYTRKIASQASDEKIGITYSIRKHSAKVGSDSSFFELAFAIVSILIVILIIVPPRTRT